MGLICVLAAPQPVWAGETTASSCTAQDVHSSVACSGPNLTSCTAQDVDSSVACLGTNLKSCAAQGVFSVAVCIGATKPTCSSPGVFSRCTAITYAEGMSACKVWKKASVCSDADLQDYAQAQAQEPAQMRPQIPAAVMQTWLSENHSWGQY